MALFWRRERTGHETNRLLADEMVRLAERHAAGSASTGVLETAGRGHQGRARLYFYEGRLYSAHLSGFTADPLARLVTGGRLSADAAARLRESPDPETQAVERGWVTIDDIALVHQEYLLASTGAVLAAGTGRAHWREGEVTDTVCTIPLDVSEVLTSLPIRQERLESTWMLVSTVGTPTTTVVRATHATTPLPSALPELEAVVEALSAPASVDEVSGSLGLTRAEGVHLVGMLVASGHAVVEADSVETVPRVLQVPEQFGEVEVDQHSAADGAPTSGDAQAGSVTQQPRPEPAGKGDPLLVARLEEQLAEAMRAERELAVRIASIQEELRAAQQAGSAEPALLTDHATDPDGHG